MIVAARMKGKYSFDTVQNKNENVTGKEELTAELGIFHFFLVDQRVTSV